MTATQFDLTWNADQHHPMLTTLYKSFDYGELRSPVECVAIATLILLSQKITLTTGIVLGYVQMYIHNRGQRHERYPLLFDAPLYNDDLVDYVVTALGAEDPAQALKELIEQFNGA